MSKEVCGGYSPWPNSTIARQATELLRLRAEGKGDSDEAQKLEKELDIKPTSTVDNCLAR